jgi:hypothetical protein
VAVDKNCKKNAVSAEEAGWSGPGAGWSGRVRMIRVEVRMIRPGQQRSGTARDEHKNGAKSRVSRILDGFRGGDGGEKLDPLVAKQIHGANPTKFHHTNKSQKILGGIFGGEFSD